MRTREYRLGLAVLMVIGVFGLITPSTAAAASIVCPNNVGFSQPIWDNVTPNLGPLGCEIGSVNNDSEATVNALDSMFNITTWEELARVDLNNSTSGVLCATVVAGCTNSTGWDTTGLTITSLMLVLKGGTAAEPDDYVGYLLPVGTSTIAFTSPFLNAGSGNAKDVSHYTMYYATEDLPDIVTPEPASLLLLGSGIIGIASRVRRKRKK